MLRPLHNLTSCSVRAIDGNIGRVADFYFDDVSWAIRYLIVDTGEWLPYRRVLVSPMSFGRVDWDEGSIAVSITKDQVRNSREIDTDKPVSRQMESAFLGYYGFPFYWGGAGLWGVRGYPYLPISRVGYEGPGRDYTARVDEPDEVAVTSRRQPPYDHDLRSCNAVTGYRIAATDGEIGHVKGFVIDDETWAIHQIIIATSNWWIGHDMLIHPSSIREVNWTESVVTVDLAREKIKHAPAFDPKKMQEHFSSLGIYRR